MLEVLVENSDKLDGAPTWIIVCVCLYFLSKAARAGFRELVDFIRSEFATNARLSEMEKAVSRLPDIERRLDDLERDRS